MSIDGSFNLESAFRRLLGRCPKLATLPSYDSVAKKGQFVTEEEVVNVVADQFLHPNYTIPLIGCFRPLARKIVDRVVALLRLVPNLRSISDDTRDYDDDDDTKGVNIVEYYVQARRGLNLHELACLAFCRALDLAPFLLGSVLTYFEFAPPPFERLLVKGAVSELPVQVGVRFLQAVRTSYRLLLTEPEVFSKQWDWSCFLDLVKQSFNFDPGSSAELEKEIADIRWSGIQILSIIFKLSGRAVENSSVKPEEAFACFLRWEEFCQDVSLEKAGMYLDFSEHMKLNSVSENTEFNQENCLQSFGLSSLSSSQFLETEPSARKQRLANWDERSSINPFVLMPSIKKSYNMVLLAVSQKWPVLLYGPPGTGKSALINKLACDSGNRVLSIHMDDQIDGKTLVGSYVCTERPGEFKWQPGSLTQAVQNGFWVVFEDIDKAPSEVQSILLPLLEGASSFTTSNGEEIRVAESFRLFSTISTCKLDAHTGTEGATLLGVLWRRVMIGPPSDEDLLDIVKIWFPNLEPLAEKLIETFRRMNTDSPDQLMGFQSGNSASISYLSRFSLRDLLKWCNRVTRLGFSFMDGGLSAYECHCIYQEAVDIFASSSTSGDSRLTTMKDIARIWAVPISVADSLYPRDKPMIQDLPSELRIGRVALQRTQALSRYQKRSFVEIRSSVHLLEKIACSVKFNEPVLLVGETGTGKTTLVQNLATRLGQILTVLNLSQQSDSADLLGGFKPMDAQFICIPLYKDFTDLFSKTFSTTANVKFLDCLQKHLSVKNWKMLLRGFQKGIDYFRKSLSKSRAENGSKRKRDEEDLKAWESFSVKVETVRGQIASSSGMVFSFVEGAFVTALKNGEWILLDEVNLAPPETLQRIIGVLEGEKGSLCLAERGDAEYISRNPNFRIFACMNPATDAGKRDLPYALRSRFTEYFVDDVLDDEDLTLFISQFLLDDSQSKRELVNKIVRFYKAAKKDSEERLQDGANQKPQYSLRSLYRALEYTMKATKEFKFKKAIYDGFCMFFLTLLDGPSAKIMNQMILSYLLGGNLPPESPYERYLNIQNSRSDDGSYVVTKTVEEHLRNLARAIFVKRYPVLLQGPTSSGKTSLVQYLAAKTGHEFVRINNHEHTDLQEYLGSYVTDESGKLVFHEGALVKAVRSGHWIVLDELNLAPSDVLEALNRLLDDNRELFVPELGETIRAHEDFMLFATQNPPTFYGGRKMLSRAFRNRFVEIHVEEIPEDELSTILKSRCKIPESYAKKMVEVMKELQLHRQSSKVFAGKHGFITPRDLFRWADRFREFGKSYEDLARDGYYLLAERLRDESEKSVVQDVLERHLRVKLLKDDLYKQESAGGDLVSNSGSFAHVSKSLENVIWTKSMLRLYFLVERCYKLREPVLLVGETGGGKTTVCQLLSTLLDLDLLILNCHQYSETSDFIGGFYPIRERSKLASEYTNLVQQLMLSRVVILFSSELTISTDVGQASETLDQLAIIINSYRQGLVSSGDVTVEDLDNFEQMIARLSQLHQKWQMIFTWKDGPLVQAMKAGDLFLVDEISLADDSVLERLNSVLEPDRKLSLAEKGGPVLEKITAHPNFLVLGTMNPGGDYGKKELSPALRNRFTEIWVPSVCDVSELRSIALERLSNPELSRFVDPMLSFWEWLNQSQSGRLLTVRDLLSWVAFINATEKSLGPEHAFLHGVFLVLLDGLSLGTGISKKDASYLRERCLLFLLEKIKENNTTCTNSSLSRMENYGWGDLGSIEEVSCCADMRDNIFGIDPFYIEKGNIDSVGKGFEFLAPTTRRNASRVLRAMQLSKPVLLEGSPGVGKTSLIVSLGKYSGHKVVRINLSEQTDIMDLLGSDLPVESDEGMKFEWSDGILLQALKEGCWVLLDELNLAPQSVLEGLNAILDHRAEVFIPELGLTFRCPPTFRIFACQNPTYQGGGRKGLPKSFLNRFTKVYVDELVEADYLYICSSLYPSISKDLLSKLILFNKRLHEDTMLYHKFGQDGSPWEFNLRDVIRSCELMQGAPEKRKVDCFLNILYVQRMRTASDRLEVLRLYEQVFGVKPFIDPFPRLQLSPQYLIVGNSAVKRNYTQSSRTFSDQLKLLPGLRHSLEAAVHCVRQQWLCILIGSPSSGKTSLIRLLAQLTGNSLNELNLSSATDISELLGCFEQYNAYREFRLVVSQVEHYINEYCSLQWESSMEAIVGERKDLFRGWLELLSNMNCDFVSSFSSMYDKKPSDIIKSLRVLVGIIEQLKVDLKTIDLPVSWSSKELDKIASTISKLMEDHQLKKFSAKFVWVVGLLIKAIENGEWIILENANLCNPTVLDRINSLVEPCGSITVNECGTVDGKPVVLHPHPNFRMFLTVNPSCGEVSRAMRNRGVEVFLMQPYWLVEKGNTYSCEDFELKDVKRFLILSGIPVDRLVCSMAEAHIYAKNEGSRLNVHITYLELARWVQLFQQLLVNGNQPIWSLHISWEHTYLSSLGEAEGWDIVSHAKIAYLSVTELHIHGSSWGHTLCLPGGWPMPLKLRDFGWYSNEASIKQTCSYLGFLGSQFASCELGTALGGYSLDQTSVSGYARTCMMDMQLLQKVMYSQSSTGLLSFSSQKGDPNSASCNEILFASNWTIEQATEKDLELYLMWFSWFGSQLEPFSHFFKSFPSLLKEELNHSIWKHVFTCRKDLKSILNLDLDASPLLSLDLVELGASDDRSRMSSVVLCKAIGSIGLLRLSYQQWNAESVHEHKEEVQGFKPALTSLRILEMKILDVLVDSVSFDNLVNLYTDLLDTHILFWRSIATSHFEDLPISARALIKNLGKLYDIFPSVVNSVLMEVKNLENIWHFQAQKSLLWVHGGHPFLPCSYDLYQKQHQLTVLCESFWPTERIKSWKHVDDCLTKSVTSSNHELRLLALQGICMPSYIVRKCSDDIEALKHLDNIYKTFLRRFHEEKYKLEAHTLSEANVAACCSFPPELMCRKSGFGSWLDIVPIIDNTSFFLDIELLKELSSIVLLEPEEVKLLSDSLRDRLDVVLSFSLNFSSRPPQCFSPHKKILLLEEWASDDAADTEMATYMLEMWYRWHQYLWSHCPVPFKNESTADGDDTSQLSFLNHPVITSSALKILQDTFAIRDYCVYRSKLKAASRSLWISARAKDSSSCLFPAACSLFKQIIYSYKKTFGADKFAKIKSIVCSLENKKITKNSIQLVSSLIASSNDQQLKSLVNKHVEPLLGELFSQSSSTDLHYSLGCAWLRIGGLRFYLLLRCDDMDPAKKYSFKCEHLEEKISMLELDIKVRQECNHLAGCFSTSKADEKRAWELENLKIELRKVQKKIVFRSDPKKFRKLKYECNKFFDDYFEKFLGLVTSISSMDLQQIVSKVRNWQEDTISFIERLSDEYTAYYDIVQPVQVAIYEMKLGLLLVLSSAMQKSFLIEAAEDNMNLVMETIYAFMRYPRGCASGPIPFTHKEMPSDNLANSCFLDINLLEKLVTVSSDANANKVMSASHAKAALHQNILLRVALNVSNARIMDNASFMLLSKIFNEFANQWMNMKVQTKTIEDYEAQQFKFKPRGFTIDSIVEVDLSSLGKLFASESFSEWKESEELADQMESDEKLENLEEEWSLMQETCTNNMVYIHNQLFGSVNLIHVPGKFEASDADRLLSFSDSYILGAGVMKGLMGLSSSSLDAKLVPEHLFRLCLEHKRVFASPCESSHKYNFYKDSNAPAMSKMIELLTSLKQRVLSLLNEWEDHAGLQKISDVVEMLLTIPLTTPLAKVLSGLQFLLNRIWALQENSAKFPLAELEHIISLASSWHKMEFDSWPALLDAVQDQYEKNAGKLWFPLYSVLQRDSADVVGHNQSTIQSLEEFIQTSNIGEFRKRLQLLLAFYGQIHAGKSLKICSSDCNMENLMIIYNVFGFYVQFLPLVSHHMETNRKKIEAELKELLKLCRWERFENNIAFENSKRTRHKLKKLIQKYTDLLQQPVMLILGQEAAQKVPKAQSLQGPALPCSLSDKNAETLKSALSLAEIKDEDRFVWLGNWKEKVTQTLQDLRPGVATEWDPSSSDIPSILAQFCALESACPKYQEECTAVWQTLEDICETTSACNDRWKDTTKRHGKRRDLDELLKLLESSGLRRHGFLSMEDERNPNQLSRFLGPSYDVHHLLLEQHRLSLGAPDAANSNKPDGLSHQSTEWKTVNEYYFKSMASVLVLQQVSLKFHKDFSLEQVNRSASFLDHLIAIQQEQRSTAYSFAEYLKRLQKCTSALGSLCSSSSQSFKAQNGHTIMKCLWEQKLLLDSLYEISNEELLLLRTVVDTHVNNCQNVSIAANRILDFITEFNQVFKKSKESLDKSFVGCDGAITTLAGPLCPYVVSVQEEMMLSQNFLVFKNFEKRLSDFRRGFDGNSVEAALLCHFDDAVEKGKLLEKQFNSPGYESKEPCQDISVCNDKDSDNCKADSSEALKRVWSNTMDVLQKLGSASNGHDDLSDSLGKVTSSKSVFEARAANLNLSQLCDDLETIFHVENLRNHSCNNGARLKHLHVLLDLICNLSNRLLQDFLAVHKTVSIMTHVLANVFASLYSQGFGVSTEGEEDDASGDVPQDASGTGMGEGAGSKDVSDQITDEDQLLGVSEKDGEDQDASGEVPGKDEKGIEMEQDFDADAFSVSEDSGEDNNEEDGDDEQLDSAMGETGTESEAIDEKLCDKDEEENPSDTKEKYDTGNAVQDQDMSSRELRAKEDDAAATADETGELNFDEAGKDNDEVGDEDDLDDKNNAEDMSMDKDEAYADPTGLNLDEPNQNSEEDIDKDGEDGLGSMEEPELDESIENEDRVDEKNGPVDETMEENEAQEIDGDGDSERADQGKEDGEAKEIDQKKEGLEPGSSDVTNDQVPNSESASQPRGDSQVPHSRNMAQEANWSGGNDDANNDSAPTRGLPSESASAMDDAMMADASYGGSFADDQRKNQLPQSETSSLQKDQPNLNRNVGDAFEQWKERVKVSTDLDNTDRQDQIEDEDKDAYEYGYVQEREKGTAQALGPAVAEQVDKNANGYKPDGDNPTENGDGDGNDDMDVDKVNPERTHVESSGLNLKSKMEEQVPTSEVQNLKNEGLPEVHSQDASEHTSLSENLVTVRRSYFSEGQNHLLSISDSEMGKARDLEEVPADVQSNATALWRRYELRTTRLSQELAEQLRLVLEPTLASKLQGDYRTGKRINMKKVISYIASHYRKDKIWLRRTRPNKRDYQVVIAVDDSRSMSESCCGEVAVEALVTVCRAMSQLEMGNLAVASYGKKGNIKLLHDFDQPFTGEAGVKMISNLTFEQENTIADEPVVDLLKYLNNLLNAASTRARLPSGHNPLQQLVLVIADGRFHEKENLKRCVREALSAKRMVAFLLLDSPQESIVDLMEASFEGGNIKFTKYLDSFPFPYYIVLKNIEALPRTLADLLRQWFELTQHSRD